MIRIDTLGGLTVRGDDGRPLAGAVAQPRRMAILALVARAGDRGVSRDRLLALLWPDADDERGPGALAQALYALRRDLGAPDAIVGAKDLRFDPALVTADCVEFAAAIARGDDARAVALYQGPFLDGFHLPGADAFSRWVEQERNALAHDYARALEALARAARTRGDATESVAWWRKLAALDPLNARVTVGLMDALAAAGDRAGALKHADVYRLLVEQELDLPPDREVLSLAEQLRRRSDVAVVTAPPADSPTGSSPPAAPPPAAPPPAMLERPIGTYNTATWRVVHRHARRSLVLSIIAIALAAGAIVATRHGGPHATDPGAATTTGAPVVAVGRIAAFGGDSAQSGLAAPLADLLSTSLARVRGIRVVSQGRMLELMRTSANGPLSGSGSGAFMNAARTAGATELIDGTLYTRPGGKLRLDLRRVDLATGSIGDVRTIEGNDMFALVDSGTAMLVSALGGTRPMESVAEVTTRSVAAYKMFERGIDAYYRGDSHGALEMLDAALGEDPQFALAAYYASLAAFGIDGDNGFERLVRAKELAGHASDRERLFILGGWAYRTSSPSLRQIAETLTVRYPAEVEGPLYTGIASVQDGDFLAAVAPLERVIRMSGSTLARAGSTCAGCDAFRWLVSAYELSDSLPAAERVARRWLHAQPGSATAEYALLETLEWAGRTTQADSVVGLFPSYDPGPNATLDYRAFHLVRHADFAGADTLLGVEANSSDPARRAEAYWALAISFRQQGRLMAALDAVHRMRAVSSRPGDRYPPTNAILEAQVLLEQGRGVASAALLDSLRRIAPPHEPESARARRHAWLMTQIAEARIAERDTAGLVALSDSIRALGDSSGYGRDRRLYHHVLGRIRALRGDESGAIEELKASIYSPNAGYTRTNYELGTLYIRAGRARDAIAVLQPALRGPLDASNLYVTRTEIEELLARAWDAAGVRDSAAAHYRTVVSAWASADPQFAPRVQAARSRLAALGR